MKVYIARDRDFSLCAYVSKPEKNDIEGYWVCKIPLSTIKIDKDLFPDLTYDSEPKEIEMNFSEININN